MARISAGIPVRRLLATDDIYARGYHKGNPGGLDAVDTDLATANIKNGITIFGEAGSTNVRDSTDANAVAGEVMSGKTFYAGGGARKTGSLTTVAITNASDAYPAGYHAGNVGGLDAIDLDLASVNIKSGVTIFGFAGDADVHDIGDATAIAAEVISGETFYAVSGGRRTGTMPIQSLSPVDDVVAAGYYSATNLSTIDVDLASANIKSGITIFGFAGAATVQDIADANAVLADVKNGITFYSVTGARKTGNLATVALAAGANAYPAGYHVGAASLTAVDGDLVTGSIKSGVTIFGVAGSTDVRDSTDANLVATEAPTGKTFYAGGGARKTGTGTKTLNPANETVVAGYYAATTLSAVDADLAVGNIAEGVTIFGFIGTFAGGALAEDVKTTTQSALTGTSSSVSSYDRGFTLDPSTEVDIIDKTDTYDANSIAIATLIVAHIRIITTSSFKVRLYMAGVQVTESAYITTTRSSMTLQGTRALSGSVECKATVYNYFGNTQSTWINGIGNGTPLLIWLAIGSIKS